MTPANGSPDTSVATLANQIRPFLHKVTQQAIDTGNPVVGKVTDLRRQIEVLQGGEKLAPAVRASLEATMQQLASAGDAASDSVRRSVALAVVTVAQELRLPLKLKDSQGEADAAPTRRRSSSGSAASRREPLPVTDTTRGQVYSVVKRLAGESEDGTVAMKSVTGEFDRSAGQVVNALVEEGKLVKSGRSVRLP